MEKEVGNALKDTDLTFRFKPKTPGKNISLAEVPFQVSVPGDLINHCEAI